MHASILTSIERIPAKAWNALDLDGNPFVRHEFLHTLEETGCVGPESGWLPHHLVVEDDRGELLAAMPVYRKSHSWGEFVFDWSWARAYSQAGLSYYPKLISMAPFTPATGPRLLTARDAQSGELRRRLSEVLIEQARAEKMSSAHLLFVNDADRASLRSREWLWRKDCQFHWVNRNYQDFDAFMATFRAEKRKKALRERRRIQEAGIGFRTVPGEELGAALWDVVFAFSAATFAQRGHEHYLNVAFFRAISERLPGSVMIKLAEHRGRPIAAAIFFRGRDTLYGRYWGAAADFHSLHFETCYYQGIDYCIGEGLARFEPGTQGEHKVPRGFEPTSTWSAHWIADARFRRAIADYLSQERSAIDQYIGEVRAHTPFRRDTPLQSPENGDLT